MSLPSTHLYYYYKIENDNTGYSLFYIGNHNVFIYGYGMKTLKKKISLSIVFINVLCYNHCASNNAITTDSYMNIDTLYFDTFEDAINIKQLLKYWHKYNNYKFEDKFYHPSYFRIPQICQMIQYRPAKLVDYIIYNKMLKEEEMKYIPFSYKLRKQINNNYDKDIFNLKDFEFEI